MPYIVFSQLVLFILFLCSDHHMIRCSSINILAHVCCRIEHCEVIVNVTEPVISSPTEIQRPKRLSLNNAEDTVEGRQPVWNDGRRFSADVLSVAAFSEDRRPAAVSRRHQQVPVRGRSHIRASRLPTILQMSQRRPSQPAPARPRQSLSNTSWRATRRFSDNDGAACSREKRRDSEAPTRTSSRLWTNMQLTAFTRRQSVQSNPPTTIRSQRATVRRSSEGRGGTQVDTWWTRPETRQSSSSKDRHTKLLDQSNRQLPPSIHCRKRRSAPEVVFTRSCRRESTSSIRQGNGDNLYDQTRERRDQSQSDFNETARMRRRKATAALRLADESFDSVLTSDLPSPTESVGSDYSSAASLSDIARGVRKDSGFRSIETQSSYGPSRKSSTGGLRRQSFQTTDTNSGRHHSIPFVANPFNLPGRSSCRPVPTGPTSSGRRQSMFSRSDEVGGSDSDWLNEWLRWRSSSEVETPDVGRQATLHHQSTGVWNSLSEKFERTFEGFDRVITKATALLHDRRLSSDSADNIEC